MAWETLGDGAARIATGVTRKTICSDWVLWRRVCEGDSSSGTAAVWV